MRVIAGKYKKRQLKVPKSQLTRPTTDKNKENLFNMIGPYFLEGVIHFIVWIINTKLLKQLKKIFLF